MLERKHSSWFLTTLAALACAVVLRDAAAQQLSPALAPLIIASGTAEVMVVPTTASFSLGILTSASSAAAAADTNAQSSKAVSEALIKAGLKRSEITGTRLSIDPRWTYDDKGRNPKRAGFDAMNTIQITTDDLARVGILIDAALSAGSTSASEVSFTAKNADEARRSALSQAVGAARADAEAMARAGGGALGVLMLLSTEQAGEALGVGLQQISVTASRRERALPSTEVVPGEIRVSAHVNARWQFVASPASK